jgi:GGDEF domain-containing protein
MKISSAPVAPMAARQLGSLAQLVSRLHSVCAEAPLSALVLLLLELDSFERLVSRHGPLHVQDCLQHVGVTVLGSLRNGGDEAFHLGGPRFAVLLPSTNLSVAQGIAEAMRRRIAGQVMSMDGRMLRLTATTAACSRTQGTSCPADVLLQAAQRALERALGNQDCHVSVLAPSAPG